MKTLSYCICILIYHSCFSVSAYAGSDLKVVLFKSEELQAAGDRIYFVAEVTNGSEHSVSVGFSPTPVVNEPAGAPPQANSGGDVRRSSVEIVVETAPLDPKKTGIDDTRIISAQGGHIEFFDERQIERHSTALKKLSFESLASMRGTKERIRCRLRTKDGVIATSEWITIEYKPEKE